MQLLVAVLLCIVLGPSPLFAQPLECIGDCNGDRVVRIQELVRLVDAVLSAACPIPEGCAVDPCLRLDTDNDGAVSINELNSGVSRLVVAVENGLVGCPTSP
jgi:hypothetical protein